MLFIDGKKFDLSDFEKSKTASRYHIQNRIQGDDIEDYQYLINKVIYPISKEFNENIYIESGYRSKELNSKVGGVSNSQHRSLKKEAAADLITDSIEKNARLFHLIVEMIKEKRLIVDQVINENNFHWIHISIKRVGTNRNQVIH